MGIPENLMVHCSPYAPPSQIYILIIFLIESLTTADTLKGNYMLKNVQLQEAVIRVFLLSNKNLLRK
jgi:hypothetical protein